MPDICPPDGAWRVVDGTADDFPGIFIDSFSGHWLVQTRDVLWPAWIVATDTLCGWKSLWWKRLDKHEKQPPLHMAGGMLTAPIFTRELGLEYEIDFHAGYSQGLFVDQRLQKQRILETTIPDGRILNLFAYTCAFSVLAASRGAQTTSVDLSRTYLDWGKRNFLRNNIDPDVHFFCKGDSTDWLRRFAAKGRSFDGIILDPPTFSRNDAGKIFRVERDFAALVETCMKLLSPGGWLLSSTNHRGLSDAMFLSMIRRGVAAAGKSARFESGSLPPDFPNEKYLKAIWAFTRPS